MVAYNSECALLCYDAVGHPLRKLAVKQNPATAFAIYCVKTGSPPEKFRVVSFSVRKACFLSGPKKSELFICRSNGQSRPAKPPAISLGGLCRARLLAGLLRGGGLGGRYALGGSERALRGEGFPRKRTACPHVKSLSQARRVFMWFCLLAPFSLPPVPFRLFKAA